MTSPQPEIDTDAAVLTVLRGAGLTAFVEQIVEPRKHMPYVVAEPSTTGDSAWVGRHELLTYSLQAYAGSRQDARALAVRAVRALQEAYLGGRLHLVDSSRSVPAPLRSGLDDVWRFECPVRVATRVLTT